MTKETIGCRYKEKVRILPSMCDSKSRLSIPAAFDLFQNMATLHADHFDIGPEGMNRRNYFWIISKTAMHFYRMPVMMDDVTAKTWIQPADRAKCERDFALLSGDDPLLVCRSIWAVMSHDTGRLVPMAGLYPDYLEFNEPAPEIEFSKIKKDFDGDEKIGEYTIRSIDMDLGGHMNNVNYVRAMLGCFTCAEIEEMDIKEIDMQFQLQCYEGETITFLKRDSDTAKMEIGAINGEGKTAFMAAIY